MFSKVWRDIQKGDIAPVYLLVGEEAYYVDETIAKLRAALGGEDAEYAQFDCAEQPVDFVMDEADTIPFFSERKLVVARNASFLRATEKGKEKIEHDLKRLEAWLGHPTAQCVTVFVAPYEKLDERKKVTKLLKQHAVLLEAQVPKEQDLAIWIQHEIRAQQGQITEDAIGKLMEMVGTNMLQMRMEIEKLLLFVGPDAVIQVEDVENLVAKTLEHDAFKMLNAYLARDVATAVTIYHELLRQKEEPIMLVGLLASNIRTMNNVYYLQKKGYHPQQIAKQLKIHPYRVKLMVENRQRPSEERLLKALHRLADVDLKLKTTGGNRERHLELFLIQPL
ncbi:DNA polymerase III subunit delta [Caryophanon tenue]|uniref:DNA polymerase III subunit delta n=1 Tax=Caryophanon tenue TaxID=33978 RepID=A0A1C0YMW3_9BACL|nr:DNA polymerase III subunit delta [Caryophanon tenue]OCS88510.1 DNA polymerase III subunit delta [Caryophanon tenue]